MAIAAVLVTVMLTWQWGRAELARAFFAFGVQGGKKVSWLVALRDKVDEIRLSIEENLPQARALVQGRRRLVETDRAFVFLCSRPIRDLDEYLPVSLRIFLKKFGVLPAHVTLFHVNQVSVAEAEGGRNFEVINLGRNIVSVSGTYGYMERPDIRGALRELQRRGRDRHPLRALDHRDRGGGDHHRRRPPVPAPAAGRCSSASSSASRRPAHQFFGLDYDAGVSKELIPVVFTREGVRVTLPELEIIEPLQPQVAVASVDQSA